MMENSRPAEENTITDVRYLYRLKKELNYTAVKDYFISSIDNDKELVMHSESDNIEIIINDEAVETIKELFNSLKNIYQNNLESMKASK